MLKNVFEQILWEYSIETSFILIEIMSYIKQNIHI